MDATEQAHHILTKALDRAATDEQAFTATERKQARHLARLIRAGIVALAGSVLLGCAELRTCEPGTCDAATAWEKSRDPFGPEPITYGTIFGAQPEPGKVTVQP